MPTNAYITYLNRLSEVQILRDLARRRSVLKGVEKQKSSNALARSAVVLLCAHLQGYVEDASEAIIDSIKLNSPKTNTFPNKLRYYLSQDILKNARQATDPERIAESIYLLYKRDTQLWAEDGNLSESLSHEIFKHGFGNPTTKDVKKYFSRFGYDEINDDLRRRLRSSYFVVQTAVDTMVQRRVLIAHGDYEERPTPNEVSQMINATTKYVRNIDFLLCRWFQRKGCPLT